ncbi:ABC transporter [Dictyobacter kobayashii]|uniref:ABC transporter n=2 Tax=Dictyobacter kobayashii TaxID=2014872 RepID=A0A402ACC1_9CHLR|nr:ABC transporter [Dictyobacter kobayashii]
MVQAVKGVSFHIEQGEIVGFLGPNGAGKTTTLKCLSGLLHPTSGTSRVLGFTPYKREKEFLRQITFVMGQRNQLLWDLPAMETFLVNKAIYDIPEKQFKRTLDELVTLLHLEPLLGRQVRRLSLGERMKCEIAGALLHQPQVLFLDEPTIGLDVTAQATIRSFIQSYNRDHSVIVLLTSHYMADITALTQRVLVIEHGTLMYDGDLQELVTQTAPYKLLRLTLERYVDKSELLSIGELEKLDGLEAIIRVQRQNTAQMAAQVLEHLPVADIMIEEPPIEQIIRDVFHGENHV